MKKEKLCFASDYREGAHPRILKRLEETNLIQSTGYGKDDICESARERKCGAMLGEAVVIPKPELLPYFFTIMKQHGALLVKGRILGIQFDVLFEDGLYETIGKTALTAADKVVRLATSWATTEESVEKLMAVLDSSVQ